MVQAAPDLGGLDASVMDAPLGQVRRVLTLIHDKAPKEDVDHELEELERGKEAAILRLEAHALAIPAKFEKLVEAGLPISRDQMLAQRDRLLKFWNDFEASTDFKDTLKLGRRVKIAAKGTPLRSQAASVVNALAGLMSEKKRIGKRLRHEIDRVSAIVPSNRAPVESALLYKAALERRGLSPESTDMEIDLDDGTVVPIISTPLPATIAHRPADLAALEQTIHDEIEAAAPHLAGLVALRWSDADTAP
jgi:hypothetical protein